MGSKEEIYIVTDVETNGPIPGEYSMLSIGSVALSRDGKTLDKFYDKLKPLPKSKEHPEVMKFWKENPAAFKEATKDTKDPKKVMNDYLKWIRKVESKFNANLVFLASPLGFDYIFVYWYLVKFNEEFEKIHPFKIPFSFHNAIDLDSFIMAHLKKPLSDCKEENMPKEWFENISKNNHKAIDDAVKRAKVFSRILKDNQK